MNVFLCTTHGKKIFIVLDNLDSFSNLNWNIWPLIWEKYTFAFWTEKVVILVEYSQVYFLTCTNRAMPWNLIQLKVLQNYFFLAVPNIIYTAFYFLGDLQGVIWPWWIWISPFLCLFVNYPSNTISPVDWYHLLDWKLNDAKKQDWVRAGEAIMFTVYGKQMSQYFREPPAAVEILPLNVNSHQQGNERIKLKLAKNTLKASLVMEKSPGGTVLYPS